jgi:hypothetical protein
MLMQGVLAEVNPLLPRAQHVPQRLLGGEGQPDPLSGRQAPGPQG